jgi:hypothetical protein
MCLNNEITMVLRKFMVKQCAVRSLQVLLILAKGGSANSNQCQLSF